MRSLARRNARRKTSRSPDDEMGALHCFLGRVIPAPETGFGFTALELTRQLHKILENSVDSVVRDRFLRYSSDPGLS